MTRNVLGGHEPRPAPPATQGGSDRAFGIVFTIVLAVIGIWPALFGGMPRWGVCAAAVVLAGITALRPRTLAPLNRLWTRFGLVLHRIVSPCVLALVFFLVVTPIGVVMRLCGHDPLALRLDRSADGYWTKRPAVGAAAGSMAKQF